MTLTLPLHADLAASLCEAADAAGLTVEAYAERAIAEAIQRDADARAPKPDSGEILRLWLLEGDAEIATKH